MSSSCSLDDRDVFLCHSDSVKDVQVPCPTFTVFGEHRRPCLNSTKCSRGNALPFVLDVSLFKSVARRRRWLRGKSISTREDFHELFFFISAPLSPLSLLTRTAQQPPRRPTPCGPP